MPWETLIKAQMNCVKLYYCFNIIGHYYDSYTDMHLIIYLFISGNL